MGGSNTQQQQVSQTSSPWAPAQGDLKGILGQVGGMIPNASLNPFEQDALRGLRTNAGYSSQFLPGATSLTNTLLAGGGASNQAPMISDAYRQYVSSLQPLTNPASLNPLNTPGFSDALRTLNSDITNQINGQFAAAGRDLSGANAQTLARGLSQGEGSLLANQYNQNLDSYYRAISGQYGAGNTTGGILSNLNQQGLQNAEAGLGTAGAATGLANDPFMRQLAAEAQARGIPLSYLSGLTGITAPIAGLGGQSSGTTTTSTQVPLSNQIIGGTLGTLGILGKFGAFA